MSKPSFSVTWDYRCPFARNAHEHLVVALEAGARFEPEFIPFSLNQAHVEEGGTPVWNDPEREEDLLAMQVGIVRPRPVSRSVPTRAPGAVRPPP